ncbi:imidazolonepropionase [Amycolatopsis bartoniae]|uniref:Imidazolonepropionase n=1 Tax=Amycolatopsis bartoniae TaxID=941986 RepID=A0A8H9IXJ5_9PSEU|nr:imidazolonepropionase [Amycolatopsis bartoniae]MBB2938754.1 imidazolonepropionase [Amycolatopsis bartoniae]TVT11468.1 imidazolonepropionase [Amycolatopsis bartoniae]GHF79924.1 imidazolonepropionase [Amycolatopsis bartoniae]
MAILIDGIGELTTNDPELGTLRDAALVLDGTQVAWVGYSRRAPVADERVDVGGRAALPGWVDSHTHLVFAGDRTAEFAARMAGKPYTAGGIAVTVEATRAASDEELAANLRRHVEEAARQGTTCLETKTGYGLSVVDEQRSARIAAEVVDEVTFLGAHLVPPGAERKSYVDLVCGEMLDAVRDSVRWVDVFCEEGAFDEAQSERVLRAARDKGLGLRVHGNQLGPGPGVQLAVRNGAASVDHCTYLTDADVDALASSGTVATLLPACDLSTRQPLAPARRLLDAGAVVALATNANPGSSYTTSMAFCVATAVLQMGMSVEEAVWAATAGGARALRRDDVGHLRPGARADVHVLDAPSVTNLAYRPGVPLTWAVWRCGVHPMFSSERDS